MEATAVWGLTQAELEAAASQADPRALLVPPRILRRVIKHDRGIPGPGLRVPHRKTYVVGRDALLAIVDRDELGLAADATLPETVILLARPDPEQLASMTRVRALIKYWRLLMHAQVHVALDQQVVAGRLSLDSVRRRIDRLSRGTFNEIRLLLTQDDYLLPPVDDQSVYIEFVAVYAELRYFAPGLLADYFPSLTDHEAVQTLIAEDVDLPALFESSQLAGAPNPPDVLGVEDDEDFELPKSDAALPHPQKRSERVYCRLMDQADRARAKDNLVRSAMLRTRAALMIGPKQARATRHEGRDDMHLLADRLRKAVGLDEADMPAWREMLAELLHPAIRFIWTPEARLLYDLQRVCLDHERGVYKLDLWAWAWSRGRVPMRRPLPSQREVLVSKHLRRASGRLKSTRLAPAHRKTLGHLLAAAVERAEEKLRTRMRPRVDRALDSVSLRASNLVEVVARRKLVEELLDRVVDRGFLTIGDLRDAISRNNLKLHDVTGSATQLISGDQLLQADRKLAELLDGVYRRGQIYLRAPQAISSAAFGTPAGRWLTRYVFVPFGGAYVLLAAAHHLIDWLAPTGTKADLLHPWTVGLLGCFLIGLLYHEQFRRACLQTFRGFWRAVRWTIFDLPPWLMQQPWLRRLLESPQLRLIARFGMKPLIFTALIVGARSLVVGDTGSWWGNVLLFAALNMLLNSRIGRQVDELVTDLAVRGWHQVRIRIVGNVLRFIVDVFSQLLEGLERVLYTVDEWLRFRGGDSVAMVAFKAVLGSVWHVVTYIVRFCVTLLIEPQVNPIKHFPVVTVAHKIILTSFLPPMVLAFEAAGVNKPEALGYATAIAFAIPGVFGFLVWELKENWRLYAANRPKNLPTVQVGHHGESMTQLLRPGFHSGTLPKVFERLRRADRRGHVSGNWRASRRHRETIQHVVERVRHFVDRDLITLLTLSPRWQSELQLGRVWAGLQSLHIELVAPTLAGDSAWLSIEERNGWLVGRVTRLGWIEQLSGEQDRVLSDALTGFYKMSGVELVREQFELLFATSGAEFAITDAGLDVWPSDHSTRPVVYDLRRPVEDVPYVEPAPPRAGLPIIDVERLVFSRNPLPWHQWVATWSQEPSETSSSARVGRTASDLSSTA